MRTVIALIALFCCTLCYASIEQAFVCRQCRLKGTYVPDGLLTADGFVAFCPKDHFVSIYWDYHKRPPKPVRVEHGVSIYVCPSCKQPIARRWDEKECPRCGSKNIKIRPTGMAVD
jgi:DNA-directed RNA polymerase subunit RPC12/RpoP